MYNNPIMNAMNKENEEISAQQQIFRDQAEPAEDPSAGKDDDQSNKYKITSNFKMGSIDRLNTQLKHSRDDYGERQFMHKNNDNPKTQEQLDREKKRQKFMDEVKMIESLTKADLMKRLEAERAKLEPKALHIKQSRREVVQLFKNLYVFYDKKLENTFGLNEDIR